MRAQREKDCLCRSHPSRTLGLQTHSTSYPFSLPVTRCVPWVYGLSPIVFYSRRVQLLHYDKDNIDPKCLKAVQKYMEMPGFTPENVSKVSKAARGLIMWAR